MAPTKRRSSPGPSSSQPKKTVAFGEGSRPSAAGGGATNEEGMGELEGVEDDESSEGEIIDDDDEDSSDDGDEDHMHVDQAVEDEDPVEAAPEPYLRTSRPLEKDEILEPDQSVYMMLHRMNVQWPCLSFDVLRDSLGDERRKFPHTAYVVTGTQADNSANNEVLVMKMGGMHRTQHDDDESDAESEGSDDVDDDAFLEYRSIPHVGTVNRIRAQPLPLNTSSLPPVNVPYHTASMSDTGSVHIFDVRPLIEALDVPGYVLPPSSKRPVHTITNHGRAEGYALDWAGATTPGEGLRLVTGDVHSKIYLTTSTESGWVTGEKSFTGHTDSVEDLQWSPSERTVFASCSADRSIRIWDVRQKGRKNVVGLEGAHEGDVNVISWNKGTGYLLVSGGDEGALKVWDLRNFKGAAGPTPSPVAEFNWHKSPITSVSWHPTETSIFAAAVAEGTVTLWDLSVEQDEDEAGEGEELDVPSQLLFEHHQDDCKEVKFLPQIPGAVVSTGAGGFNCFKTISV